MAGYGPALPPGFADNEGESPIKRKDKRKDDTESDSSSDSSSSSSGDESPRKRKKTETSHAVIGPVIPQHLRAVAAASGAVEDKDDDEDFYGIGPVPEMAVKVGSVSVAAEFEQRAKKMKDKLLNPHAGESEITGRETWMTELPTQVANAFAGKMPTARKLTAGKDRATEDERAEWTDTPADKVRKEQERLEGRGGGKRVYEQVESSRDKMMAEKIQEFNQEKRAESLLDMHQKKIHKNDKKEKKKKSKSKKDKKEKKEKKKKKHKEKGKQKEEKVTRVPFDRETDLQVNKFDDAKRKLMIKRSAELNTRFGHSSAQKFL